MSEQTVPPLTIEQAQTEANIIKNFEQVGYPDLIIDKQVATEFKDKMKGTAKIDIAHQMYEQFGQQSPERLQALVAKDNAVVNITNHLVSKHKGFESLDATTMQKQWETQTKIAKQLVSNVVLGMAENKEEEQTHTTEGFTLIKFAKAVDSMIEKHDLSNSDQKVFGELLTAVTAELELADQNNKNSGPNLKIDVNKSFRKQQEFDSEFEKNKNKAVPPQPLV